MKRWWVVAVGLLLVAGIAVGVLLLHDEKHPSTASPTAQSTTGTAPQIDWVAEEPKARSAVDKLVTDPKSVLAAGALEQFGPRLAEAIPPGTTITPVEGSWKPDNISGATMLVDATMPGRATARYVVVLERLENGSWKIMATVPVTS